MTRTKTDSETAASETRTWIRFAVGRAERPEDEVTLRALEQSFEQQEFDFQKLLISTVASPAFRHRVVE